MVPGRGSMAALRYQPDAPCVCLALVLGSIQPVGLELLGATRQSMLPIARRWGVPYSLLASGAISDGLGRMAGYPEMMWGARLSPAVGERYRAKTRVLER